MRFLVYFAMARSMVVHQNSPLPKKRNVLFVIEKCLAFVPLSRTANVNCFLSCQLLKERNGHSGCLLPLHSFGFHFQRPILVTVGSKSTTHHATGTK